MIHVCSVFSTGRFSQLVLTRFSASISKACITGLDPITETFKIYSFLNSIAVFTVLRLKTASICNIISTSEYLCWFDLRAMYLNLIFIANLLLYLRNRARYWEKVILCNFLTSKCVKNGIFGRYTNCATERFWASGFSDFNETLEVIYVLSGVNGDRFSRKNLNLWYVNRVQTCNR